MKNTFVFDFDSTLITKESFDEILSLAIGEDEKRKQKVADITNAGMNGEKDLSESLQLRIEMANITQDHIDHFAKEVCRLLTPGMQNVIAKLQQREEKIYIVSGGFLESIFPVADFLNIPREYCFGNTFIKDSDGKITGIDFQNPLSKSTGKGDIIDQEKKKGNMTENIICIGDGISDALPFEAGKADQFWAFFQNVSRKSVEKKSSHVFFSSEDMLLYLLYNT